ncbi:MAG: hypothetical protein FJ083_09925 [Cyanobacteria bacterium K_Offshore_surface_m2_239]|nr:hypothetical protein [Cyanobacteria bacterium K_Offshore_surface_m2_239]
MKSTIPCAKDPSRAIWLSNDQQELRLATSDRHHQSTPGLILVCGLGGLGRACVQTLLRFEIPLRCLDLQSPEWLERDWKGKIDQLVVLGDMRSPAVLARAGVEEARSVLLLSSDSGVNLAAALQVRLLNPAARVVVRSGGGKGLERHLQQRLPELEVVDPELLTAGVFANALRTDGSEGAFSLGGERFRIRRDVLTSDSPDDLFTLQGRQRRLLQWQAPRFKAAGDPASQWWDLDQIPLRGDQLLWLELVSRRDERGTSGGAWFPTTRTRLRLMLESLAETINELPRRWGRWQLAGALGFLLVVLVGIIQFGAGSPLRGALLTLALLKGEYLDALGSMTDGAPLARNHLPLAALSLAFALGGTLLTAWILALVVDWLLARRLGMREPPPLAAGTPYVLLVEGDRLAERIEGLLPHGRTRVRRVRAAGQRETTPAFPSLDRALRQLRHCHCLAVAVLDKDLMANLETALTLQDRFPRARLAVRSQSRGRSDGLGQLFPGVEVINPLELAAEAVVATAFGERVREVLRIADRNLLLIDYQVIEGDTLAGQRLDAVATGYGVIPLSLVAAGQDNEQVLPSLERVLQAGDAMVVLAPLSGLRAVEAGAMRPPLWRLELQGTGPGADLFEAKMLLARHFDRPPGEMAPYLDLRDGPQRTPPLHQPSARSLETTMRRLGIQCALIRIEAEPRHIGEDPDVHQENRIKG